MTYPFRLGKHCVRLNTSWLKLQLVRSLHAVMMSSSSLDSLHTCIGWVNSHWSRAVWLLESVYGTKPTSAEWIMITSLCGHVISNRSWTDGRHSCNTSAFVTTHESTVQSITYWRYTDRVVVSVSTSRSRDGLKTYQRLVSAGEANVSASSRSREVSVSVSSLYVSCPSLYTE